MTGPAYATDDERWAAIVERARTADGAFVYAVETTGIFCRPSCPSKRALRKNVCFFETTLAAERAGYRPCKRCRPTLDDPRHRLSARLVRACRLLEEGEITRTDALARTIGLSPFHFQRQFKKLLGVTPQAYRRRVVAERAKTAIARAPSVTAAIYDSGYASSGRFYEGAGRELGMTPLRARAGAEGEHVRFVTRRCSLGSVLVAWTELGVCDVRFAPTELAAARTLRERFPRAKLERAVVPPWVDAVVDAVERPRALDLPLDIDGTAFQERVWRQLRRIPVGETRTYAEIAAKLGMPQGHRAVAAACASNTIAVAIPCHRVVRSDGHVSGYRWGPERKEALLQREGRQPKR